MLADSDGCATISRAAAMLLTLRSTAPASPAGYLVNVMH